MASRVCNGGVGVPPSSAVPACPSGGAASIDNNDQTAMQVSFTWIPPLHVPSWILQAKINGAPFLNIDSGTDIDSGATIEFDFSPFAEPGDTAVLRLLCSDIDSCPDNTIDSDPFEVA